MTFHSSFLSPTPPRAPASAEPKPQGYLAEVQISPDKLPSMGKLYPKNAIIKYRPYTFGEVKKISQDKLTVGENLKAVISGISTSFDPMTLTLADTLYLGLLRKISTFGDASQFRAQYQCHCGKVDEFALRLTELEFDEIRAPEFPITIDFTSGTALAFSPITVGEFIELCARRLETDEVASYAVQVRTPGISFEKALEILYAVTGEDAAALMQADEYMYHGLKPIVRTCSNEKCKARHDIELDGGQALILPFRNPAESARRRIRFGEKPAY